MPTQQRIDRGHYYHIARGPEAERDRHIHDALLLNPDVTTNELVQYLARTDVVPLGQGTNNANVGSVLTRLSDTGWVLKGPKRRCDITGVTVFTWRALTSALRDFALVCDDILLKDLRENLP